MSGTLVMAPVADGAVGPVAGELVAAAASCPPGPVVLGLLGAPPGDAVDAAGADRVVAVPGAPPGTDLEADAAAARALLDEVEPDVVLTPFDPDFAAFGARLAAERGMAFVADVTGLAVHDDGLVAVRPVHAGKLDAEVVCPSGTAAWVQVRPGAFGPAAPAEPVAVSLLPAPLAGPARVRHVEWVEPPSSGVDLAHADVVVSVGRGVGEENVGLFAEIARRLGVALGSSRPVVDAGWLPQEHQIGQSGTRVAPRLYVAFGISGALQHLVGIQGAKQVVAVNTDPAAPIFSVASLGAVADAVEVGKEMLNLL